MNVEELGGFFMITKDLQNKKILITGFPLQKPAAKHS